MIPFLMCFIQVNTSIYSIQRSFFKNIFVLKLKICATYISLWYFRDLLMRVFSAERIFTACHLLTLAKYRTVYFGFSAGTLCTSAFPTIAHDKPVCLHFFP